MGHGSSPLISKIRVHNPNLLGTKKANINNLIYIATREGVDLTRTGTEEEIIYGESGEDDEKLKYMTNTPRQHGLFGNVDTQELGDIEAILKNACDENKCIYRGMISLGERDAKALGYNTAEKWKLYLESVMPDIAKELRISPTNHTWVGAFHAEDGHPHVHYMLWDNREIVHSPYIHISTQNKCRDICQNAMFTEENENIIKAITEVERKEYYQLQNASRTEITDFFKKVFEEDALVPGVVNEILPGRTSEEEHKKINDLYKKIIATMPGSGRTNYKFMPPECKAYIDSVTEQFLKSPSINKEYHQYIEAVEKIHEILGKTDKEIEQQKKISVDELKSRTGNIILKAVYNMRTHIISENDKSNLNAPDEESFDNISIVPEPESQEPAESNQKNSMDKRKKSNSKKEYKNFTENKEIKRLMDKKSDEYNPIKAEEYLRKALEINAQNMKGEEIEDFTIQNRILLKLARLHKDSSNYVEALSDLSQVIMDKSGYVNQLKGQIYADKNYVYYNYHKALTYFDKCIKQLRGEGIPVVNSFIGMAAIFSDKEGEYYNPQRAENCLNRALNANKQMYKNTTPDNMTQNRIWLKLARLYSDYNSPLREYGKALNCLSNITEDKTGAADVIRGNIYGYGDEKFETHNMQLAVKCYMAAAEKANTNAMVKLAKCYLYGMGVEKNKEMAVYWLESAVDFGDEYAKDYLKKVNDNSVLFKSYTYMLVRQLMFSVGQEKQKKQQQINEAEFKTKSKQVKKEEYLHRD